PIVLASFSATVRQSTLVCESQGAGRAFCSRGSNSMSLSMRRTVLVLLGLSLLALVALLQPASGQPIQIQMKGGPVAGHAGGDKNPNEFNSAIDLPTEPKLKKKLAAAEDYIREESWGEASRILQGLLDITEDKFVEDEGIGTDGKKTTKWVSVRTKAN